MAKIKINRKRCKGCQYCIIFCPKKNITLDKTLNESGVSPAVIITEDNCTGCGICYLMCPDCCIEII
ncbi:MAG: 4Fe-4S dicluster domain-containing protein [Candidatus Omnitrophota bacterium]